MDEPEFASQLVTTGAKHSKKGRVCSAETEGAEHENTPNYWQELTLIKGVNMNNIGRHIVRLLACIRYPAVSWAFLVGGTFSGWFSGLSITLAQIFSVPPISYTPTELGHLNTFPTVGAIAAFAVLSFLADSSARWAARKNHCIYEPEFRLYLISFGFFIGVPGLALFGWYAARASPEHEISWVVLSFLYGMIIFTTVTLQSTSFAYLLDAHRDISIETAVFVVMVRNFFSFAAGKFLPPWLNHSGTAKTFYAIAGLQAALILATVPLYVFGKIVRSALAKS
ncbi:MAG: hypothetical protein LQ342_005509 [Letrouitia transgressa]|nr:MAG: hypothetical protein LQ342_005509 [Letrouitia transgressa]